MFDSFKKKKPKKPNVLRMFNIREQNGKHVFDADPKEFDLFFGSCTVLSNDNTQFGVYACGTIEYIVFRMKETNND